MFLRSCSFGYVPSDMSGMFSFQFQLCSGYVLSTVLSLFGLRSSLCSAYYLFKLRLYSVNFVLAMSGWGYIYCLGIPLCSVFVPSTVPSNFCLFLSLFWLRSVFGFIYFLAAMFCWPYFCRQCSSIKAIRGDLQE